MAAATSMRVLLWSELFWPYVGGAEAFAAGLLPALRDRGHEFLVLTSHDSLDLPDAATFEGIPVRRLPFRAAVARRDLAQIRALRAAVAALQHAFAPDLIHVNGLGPSVLLHLLTRAVHPAPWLLALQQEVLPDQVGRADTLLHRALSSAECIVACAEAVLGQARALVPEIAPRASVIRNAVDVPATTPAPLPFAPPRVLCLARLVPAKGQDIALTAFAGLRRRFPALRLVLAGDGATRPALERQARVLGIADAVDFLGWVDPAEVPALLNAATVVVLPSRREGLPLAAVEAALMARPVVATRVGGLPEVVIDGETGLLVDPEDASGLAAAVARLLERPRDAARLGRTARARTRDVLGWKRCVDAYEAIYRAVGGGS
jgi:glycogen(starch) synthase